MRSFSRYFPWQRPSPGFPPPCGMPAAAALRAAAGTMLCILFLSGCMKVGPEFALPPQPLPEQWSEADLRHAFRGDATSAEWWTHFHDPSLSALVLRARRESPTVETALLRVAQARALYGQAVGRLFPQQQALTGEYEWSRPSRRAPDAAQPGEPSDPSSVRELNVGMQMSWELDFWGKYRRGAEAARDALMAAQAAHELALVTLSADVAQSYLKYRTLQEQIRIAEKNDLAQREAVRLTEARFRHGAVSERDYAQALAQQKSTEADLPALRGQLRAVRNALCVLLGQAPGPLAELEGSGIPGVAGTIAVGIPSDVIRRRPDVRRAERLAASQCAQIGVREADLFPAFTLGGFIGFQGSDVGAFTLGQTWGHGFTANAGPSVLFPFLNYGRLLNAVRAQDAVFQQALTSYRQTVLAALEEAENAMTSFLRAQERLAVLKQARDAADRAVRLTLRQYLAGSVDFTGVVLAQSSLYEQENAVAVTTGEAARQAVQIFRALGGGWKPEAGLPPQTVESMKRRTAWGGLLDEAPLRVPSRQASPAPAAPAGSAGSAGSVGAAGSASAISPSAPSPRPATLPR